MGISASSQTFENLAQQLGVRKVTVHSQEIISENGSFLSVPVTQVAVAVTVKNPWLDTDTTTDLSKVTPKLAPVIAKLVTDRLIETLGSANSVQAFGKAAIAGNDGELEHAAALIHTPYFGNIMRELLEGTSIICFADGRGEAGEQIKVPMWHKTTAALRDYYQTIDISIPDSPHRDEICIIGAASNGPRPFPRIGDRTTDPEVSADILKGYLS